MSKMWIHPKNYFAGFLLGMKYEKMKIRNPHIFNLSPTKLSLTWNAKNGSPSEYIAYKNGLVSHLTICCKTQGDCRKKDKQI